MSVWETSGPSSNIRPRASRPTARGPLIRAIRDLEPNEDDDDGAACGDPEVEVESASPRPALAAVLWLLKDVLEPLPPEMRPYVVVLTMIVDLLREQLDPARGVRSSLTAS